MRTPLEDSLKTLMYMHLGVVAYTERLVEGGLVTVEGERVRLAP